MFLNFWVKIKYVFEVNKNRKHSLEKHWPRKLKGKFQSLNEWRYTEQIGPVEKHRYKW
jgi:hypothetical protein